MLADGGYSEMELTGRGTIVFKSYRYNVRALQMIHAGMLEIEEPVADGMRTRNGNMRANSGAIRVVKSRRL